MMKQTCAAIGMCSLLAATTTAATIIGPTPYLALSDTPDGVFTLEPDERLHIENFEDPNGPWETCFTMDFGERFGPNRVSGGGVPVTDSVDADDGVIDGEGTMGSSWFTDGRILSIRFDEPTKTAGFVFTDTDNRATQITISAYGADGSELISQDFANFVDDVFTGTTAEDRFFAVSAMDNELIKRIQIEIDSPGSGIEIDHVQFIKAIPEPSSLALVMTSLLGLTGQRRRPCGAHIRSALRRST